MSADHRWKSSASKCRLLQYWFSIPPSHMTPAQVKLYMCRLLNHAFDGYTELAAIQVLQNVVVFQLDISINISNLNYAITLRLSVRKNTTLGSVYIVITAHHQWSLSCIYNCSIVGLYYEPLDTRLTVNVGYIMSRPLYYKVPKTNLSFCWCTVISSPFCLSSLYSPGF